VRNRSVSESSISGDFNEQHYSFGFTLGKRLSLYSSASLSVGVNGLHVGEYRPGRTASPSGTDIYTHAGIGIRYDTRDLAEYPSRGTSLWFGITKIGFGESDVNFARLGGDLRGYLPLPFDVTLAGRAHTSLAAGGQVPSYSHVYFGYGDRIKGYYNTIVEGENAAGAIVELRWPLLPARVFRMRTLPLPEEFTVWRFGIGLGVFANTGTAWFRGEPVSLRRFASGYGGGVHFLLPYGAVVRLEGAWNDRGRAEFVLDLRSAL
jgi:outer membrane protein assembly factor BamA